MEAQENHPVGGAEWGRESEGAKASLPRPPPAAAGSTYNGHNVAAQKATPTATCVSFTLRGF